MLLFLAAAAPATQPISRMSTNWWHDRFNAKQAELRAHPPALIWLGDSITQDFELSGPEPWRDFVPVWNKYYAPLHAVNLGFKGDSTSHLIWRLQNGELDHISPRLAIILIGANNFGRAHWPAAPTLEGIETVVSIVEHRLPATKILLLGVLPSIRSAWVDENTIAVNRGLAERYRHDSRVVFRDLTPLFMKSGRLDPTAFLDGHLTPPDPPLHPTAQSQARMAQAIDTDVRRLMQ